MAEEIQKIQPVEEPIKIDMSEGGVIEVEEELSRTEAMVYATNKLKQPLSSVPTSVPTNFYQQFEHYNDNLYCNINNTWKAIGGGVKVRVYLSSATTIADVTELIIPFDTEGWDTGSDFNTSTYKFTAPNTGYYLVTFRVIIQAAAADDDIFIYILRNTTKVASNNGVVSKAGYESFEITDTVSCTAGDTIEGKIYHNCGSTRNIAGGTDETYMTINEL